MTMYSSFPKSDRIKIRVALCAAWGATAFAGGVGVLLDLGSIVASVGEALPFWASLTVAVFSTFATVGVALDKYWVEWASAWFTAGGVFIYAVLMWALAFGGQTGRFQTAGLLSALLAFYAYRIISCSAHARKQRRIHELVQSGEVRLP